VTGLTVSFGPIGEAIPDANGNVKIEINGSDMDMVYAMLPESGNKRMAVFLQALTLPSDTEVKLDALSTAVAMVTMSVPVTQLDSLSSLGKVRTEISKLPEVIALASILENALNTDPYFLNVGSQNYYVALSAIGVTH